MFFEGMEVFITSTSTTTLWNNKSRIPVLVLVLQPSGQINVGITSASTTTLCAFWCYDYEQS